MNNKSHSGLVLYVLHGARPKQCHLGLYSTFNDAYDAMHEYFEQTLDEDGAGKDLYQYDLYNIFTQEVDLGVTDKGTYERIAENYIADYSAGTLKQVDINCISSYCL
jgi:hypothetical protein